jgi:hypothetical protein
MALPPLELFSLAKWPPDFQAAISISIPVLLSPFAHPEKGENPTNAKIARMPKIIRYEFMASSRKSGSFFGFLA